eukprot:3536116-Pyramimonas_sp.AAC.2
MTGATGGAGVALAPGVRRKPRLLTENTIKSTLMTTCQSCLRQGPDAYVQRAQTVAVALALYSAFAFTRVALGRPRRRPCEWGNVGALARYSASFSRYW